MTEYRRKSKKGRITIVRRGGSRKLVIKNPVPSGVREIIKRQFIPYNTFDSRLTDTQRKYREKSNLAFAPSYILNGLLLGSAAIAIGEKYRQIK